MQMQGPPTPNAWTLSNVRNRGSTIVVGPAQRKHGRIADVKELVDSDRWKRVVSHRNKYSCIVHENTLLINSTANNRQVSDADDLSEMARVLAPAASAIVAAPAVSFERGTIVSDVMVLDGCIDFRRVYDAMQSIRVSCEFGEVRIDDDDHVLRVYLSYSGLPLSRSMKQLATQVIGAWMP